MGKGPPCLLFTFLSQGLSCTSWVDMWLFGQDSCLYVIITRENQGCGQLCGKAWYAVPADPLYSVHTTAVAASSQSRPALVTDLAAGTPYHTRSLGIGVKPVSTLGLILLLPSCAEQRPRISTYSVTIFPRDPQVAVTQAELHTVMFFVACLVCPHCAQTSLYIPGHKCLPG